MKGDFTRDTFKREKHYSSVRMQQGRVQMDADWNEMADIWEHWDRTTRRDAIGPCGGPQGADGDGRALAGFKITREGRTLRISKGRYYVEGILCENEEDVLIASDQGDDATPSDLEVQPYLPSFDFDPAVVFDEPNVHLVYLDVWERHITALEDGEIREVALGGPDTATRTQVIWQVKLLKVNQDTVCDDFIGWRPPGTESTGRLAARAEPGVDDEGLCLTGAKGGYRRLENQLYRIEIREGGPLGEATFVWSRENGSVVATWEAQDGNDLIVSSASRDSALGFAAGDWVELTDDARELTGEPGVLVRLANVVETERVLTIDATATGVSRNDFGPNPKIRRWDGSNGAEVVRVPVENDGWLPLEDGVEIRFEAGTYQTGDYWLIPARTALGDVLWPTDDTTGEPAFKERMGIEHSYCPLALIRPGEPVPRGLVRVVPAQPEPIVEIDEEHLAVSFEKLDEHTLGLELKPDVQLPDGGSFTDEVINRLDDVFTVSLLAPLTLSIEADDPNDFLRLNDIRFEVGSGRLQAIDCRSLFPPLTEVGEPLPEEEPEPRIRIERVVLLGTGAPLGNDASVSAEVLAGGVRIDCDRSIFPDSVQEKPTCYVAVNLPFPSNDVDARLWGMDPGEYFGFRPVILRTEDGSPTADGEAVIWKPHEIATKWLVTLIDIVRDRFHLDRVLAHLTLKGNFIWSDGTPRQYLDGDAFGFPRSNGTTGLEFPSGDGRRGGDFEMWFWLIP